MADATLQPSHPPQPRIRRALRVPRRPGRVIALFLAGLILLLALLTGGFALFIGTDTGRVWITGKINGILKHSLAPSGLSAHIDALDTSLPSRLGFRGLVVADADGPWLHVEQASLTIGWSALRQNHVMLRSLRVDHPVLMRLPHLPESPQTEPSPPADPTMLLTSLNQWPAGLPSMSVEKVEINALSLGMDLMGEAMTLTLRGSASASSQAIQTELSVRRDDKPGAEQAEARISLRQDAFLSLSLTLTETPDGMLMRAVPPALAQAPALRFLFQGAAPLADWHGDVQLDLLDTDPQINTTSLNDRTILTLKGTLDGAVLAPTPSLSWDLTASTDKASTGLWRMAGQDSGQALAHLTGKAAFKQSGAAPGTETSAGGDIKTWLDAQGHLALELSVLEWTEPLGDTVIGPRATLKGDYTLQWRGAFDGASRQAGDFDASLNNVTLEGRALSAKADASCHLANMEPMSPLSALNLSLTADMADTADLADFSARGPLRAHLLVKGAMSALNADLSMEGESVTVGEETLERPHIRLNTADLNVSALMAHLSGTPPAGTIAAPDSTGRGMVEVSGRARGQDVNLNSHWELKPGDSLTAIVRELTMRAAGVRVDGDVSVVLPPFPVSSRTEESKEERKETGAVTPPSPPPALTGMLRAEVTDWSLLNALTDIPVRAGKALLALNLRSGPEGQSANASIAVDNLRMDAAGGGEQLFVSTLRGTVNAENIFRSPRVTADISGGDIRAAGMDLHDIRLTARGPLNDSLTITAQCQGDVTADLDASWKTGEAAVRTLQVHLSERFARATIQTAPEASQKDAGSSPGATEKASGAMAPSGPWGVRLLKPALLRYGPGGFSTPGLDLALDPSGTMRFSGALNGQSLKLTGHVDALNLGLFRPLLPALPEAVVQAQLALTGTPARPEGSLAVHVDGLQRPGSLVPPLSCALEGTLKPTTRGGVLDAALSFPPETLHALGAKQAAASLSLPLLFTAGGLPQPVPGAALRGEVLWEGNLAPLWNFAPLPDRRLSGQGNLRLNVAGSLERPELTGHVAITRAAYEDLNLGLLLNGIDAEIQMDKAIRQGDGPLGSLGRAHLSLRAGDGTDGTLTLDGFLEPATQAIELNGGLDNFKPLRRQDLRVNLSGDATVSGTLASPDVKAAITVNQGELIISQVSGASIPTLPISDAEDESIKPSPPPGPLGSMDVQVTVPSRFFVRGHGLESDWRGQIRAQGPLNSPELVGTLSAARGTLDLLNRTFFLTKGVIILDGGQTINPRLDIVMSYNASNLEADISIGGTASRPRIKLTSKPAMPQDEIIAQVMFGRPTGKLGHIESLQMATAVAALAGFGSGGSGAFDVMRKALGADVVRLGSADGSEDGLGGTTLEVGRYINDKVYVGVSQGLDSDSTGAVVNVNLTRHITLDARTTSTKSEVGVEWSYDY